MKTYILDIIPQIKQFSKKLDIITVLTNQHWVVLDEISKSKSVYIFRSNNELLISQNGKVNRARWEYLGHNSLLIDIGNETYLFKHDFYDANILTLKVDGKNEYAVLINENKYEYELNSLDSVVVFLKSKYIDGVENKVDKKLSEPKSNVNELGNDNSVTILRQEEDWSLVTGKVLEYTVKYKDDISTVLFIKKKGVYTFSTFDKVIEFENLEDCLAFYKSYIDKK